MAPRRTNSASGGLPVAHWTERTGRQRLTHSARGPTALERRREQTLAEWYGAELASAEIGLHRAEPRLVGDLMDAALRRLRHGDDCGLERVRELWPALVGPDIARRAVPVTLRDRVLTVEVANSTWRYVLEREHRQRLRDRLAEATAGAVAEICFVPPGRTVTRHAE
jgi:hypothetical protein